VVAASAIPALSLIERMSTERAPVTAFAPRSVAARAYRDLWSEISKVSSLDIHDLLTAGGVVMAMVKTPIEIDEEALATAAEVLGTKTKKDTVNAALREVMASRRRAVALTRLRDAATDGAFDLAVLQDKQRYLR
jgi:Arc/MetJ family transcription regulator